MKDESQIDPRCVECKGMTQHRDDSAQGRSCMVAISVGHLCFKSHV
jgi:hypothetical protein